MIRHGHVARLLACLILLVTQSPALAATAAPLYAPLAFTGLSLQTAQDDAVALSPDVEIARAKLDFASSNLTAARAGFGPSLIAGYAQNPQTGPLYPAVQQTVTQTTFNLGVQATLLSFAQYLPLLYQAQASYGAARADEATAERNERMRAANLYFSALQARAALEARREALSLAQAQQQAAQRRYNAGDAPRIDVVRAVVAAAQALAASENAQAADANATQALALETGAPLTTIAEVEQGTAPAITTGATTVDSAVQQAMARRAEIASANEDVAGAAAGVNAARAAALPAVTIAAGYEHGYDTGQAIKGATLNASFELPFNGSQTAKLGEANAAVVQSRAQLRAAQRQVTLEVSAAVRNLNAAILATAASTKAREAAQEEVHATEIGYRTGGTSSLERTAANATYADARLAELSAIYAEALARAILELELGP